MTGAGHEKPHRAAGEVGMVSLLAAVFIIFALAYNFASPPFEPYDEGLHLAYVRDIQQERALPVVDLDGPPGEEHQPPLYYLLAALIAPVTTDDEAASPPANPFFSTSSPGDNANLTLRDPLAGPFFSPLDRQVRVIRIISTGLGVIALGFIYLSARQILGSWQWGLAATALAMLNPQVIYSAATITNDALVLPIASAALYLFVRLAEKESPPTWREWIPMALVLGLALITKLTSWVLLPTAAIVVAVKALQRRSWRLFITGGVFLAAGAALVGGWWLARNWQLYGDLTGQAAHIAVWGVEERVITVSSVLSTLIHDVWEGLWIRFGNGQITAPRAIYWLINAFAFAALAGIVVDRPLKARDAALKAALVAPLTLVAVSLVVSAITQPHVVGRHTFAGYPSLALLLAIGIRGLFCNRREYLPALITAAATAALALYAVIGVLRPAYAFTGFISEEALARSGFSPLGWEVGEGQATLIGYDVSPSEVRRGDDILVTLYWRVEEPFADNYVLFAHPLSADYQKLGERNTYPGMGKFATTFWQPGMLFADTVTTSVTAETAYTGDLWIILGLYQPATGQNLPVTGPDGAPVTFTAIPGPALVP